METENEEVKLKFGEFTKVLNFRNHSLIAEASIRKVFNVDAKNVRAVTMAFQGLMRDLVDTPGWNLSLDRRTPFLVVRKSKALHDSYPQFNRVEFPYRSTVIKKGGLWEVVEVAEKKRDEEEIEESEGEPTTITTFFHREMEDVNDLGIILTGDDDPFLRPAPRRSMEVEPTEAEGAARIWVVWQVFGGRRL